METKTGGMERHSLSGREILIALAIKHNGNWDKIYESIRSKDSDDLTKYLEKIDTNNCITLLDESYPQILKQIYQPPFVLFTRGDSSIMKNPNLITSVIGTRNPTSSGKEATKTIVNNHLKEKIICVGSSKGTTEVVLDTCISNKRKAIVVLASGFNHIYPSEMNKYIAELINSGSCIVSEYPDDAIPEPAHFPLRNRIVVGLAKQTCAMEMNKNSGTAISLTYALSFNREVYVLPVDFTSEFANNHFIAEGANPITSNEACLNEDSPELPY